MCISFDTLKLLKFLANNHKKRATSDFGHFLIRCQDHHPE